MHTPDPASSCLTQVDQLKEERDTLVDKLLSTNEALQESEQRYQASSAAASQVGESKLDGDRIRRGWGVQASAALVIYCSGMTLHIALLKNTRTCTEFVYTFAHEQVHALLEQLQDLLRRAETERDRAQQQLRSHLVRMRARALSNDGSVFSNDGTSTPRAAGSAGGAASSLMPTLSSSGSSTLKEAAAAAAAPAAAAAAAAVAVAVAAAVAAAPAAAAPAAAAAAAQSQAAPPGKGSPSKRKSGGGSGKRAQQSPSKAQPPAKAAAASAAAAARPSPASSSDSKQVRLAVIVAVVAVLLLLVALPALLMSWRQQASLRGQVVTLEQQLLQLGSGQCGAAGMDSAGKVGAGLVKSLLHLAATCCCVLAWLGLGEVLGFLQVGRMHAMHHASCLRNRFCPCAQRM